MTLNVICSVMIDVTADVMADVTTSVTDDVIGNVMANVTNGLKVACFYLNALSKCITWQNLPISIVKFFPICYRLFLSWACPQYNILYMKISLD